MPALERVERGDALALAAGSSENWSTLGRRRPASACARLYQRRVLGAREDEHKMRPLIAQQVEPADRSCGSSGTGCSVCATRVRGYFARRRISIRIFGGDRPRCRTRALRRRARASAALGSGATRRACEGSPFAFGDPRGHGRHGGALQVQPAAGDRRPRCRWQCAASASTGPSAPFAVPPAKSARQPRRWRASATTTPQSTRRASQVQPVSLGGRPGRAGQRHALRPVLLHQHPLVHTPFGRDSVIHPGADALDRPAMSRGVIAYLAATQADGVDTARGRRARGVGPRNALERDGGKPRRGAVTGRCSGSVDATPLLGIRPAGAYFERTASPRCGRMSSGALDYDGRYGNRDGDGFSRGTRGDPTGLVQQVQDWQDSVFHHEDASSLTRRLPCAKMQASLYDARLRAAAMADALAETARAESPQAEQLRAAFEDQFWCEELRTYAVALDGEKRAPQLGGHLPATACWAASRRSRACAPGRRRPPSAWRPFRAGAFGRSRPRSCATTPDVVPARDGCVWPHDDGIIAAGAVAL